MPRTIGNDLKTHFAGSVTTIAQIWVITRTDNEVFRFTNHSEDIIYSGQTYKSLYTIDPTAINQSSDLAVDNVDFNQLLNDNDIKYDDLRAGLFDLASVQIWLLNYEDHTMGTMPLISGTFGEVRIINEVSASFEFRSLAEKLQQGIGRTYTHECSADFCDSKCGLTLATYTVTGTLTAVTDNQYFVDSSRSEADDYFTYGVLTFTSGLNNGLSMEVKTWTASLKQFQLFSPMPFTVQVGDTYSVWQGCDKKIETCTSTFNNAINFRGFPYIPGMDKVLRVPDINEDAGIHGGGY